MCKCYVVTAKVRFVQCTKENDDRAEVELKAKQALDVLPAVTVDKLEIEPFGE